MSDTRAEILQRIIRREPKSQSSFGTGEGVSLVATALSRIADEKITITEFYSTLTDAASVMGTQLEKSWKTDYIHKAFMNRVNSRAFSWPDKDLSIFIGLVSEKIGKRYFELKQLAPRLFNGAKFQKLHLNESSPEFVDKKHLLTLLHQFAGGNWPDIAPKSNVSLSWNASMTRMKDLYYDILEKAKSNTDSPYSVDSICAIRSFLLSLYLLSVLDESFFLESFKAFLDKYKQEVFADYVSENISKLVETKQAEIISRNRLRFGMIGHIVGFDEYDPRKFWRKYRPAVIEWIKTADEEARQSYIAQVAQFCKSNETPATAELVSKIVNVIEESINTTDGRHIIPLVQAVSVGITEEHIPVLHARLGATLHELIGVDTPDALIAGMLVCAALCKEFQTILKPEAADGAICDWKLCTTRSPKNGDKSGWKVCGKCHIRLYCSQPCQVADWKEGHHKALCTTWATYRVD